MVHVACAYQSCSCCCSQELPLPPTKVAALGAWILGTRQSFTACLRPMFRRHQHLKGYQAFQQRCVSPCGPREVHFHLDLKPW